MTQTNVRNDYRAFVASKLKAAKPDGFDWPNSRLNIPLRQVTLKPDDGSPGLFTGGCSAGMCY